MTAIATPGATIDVRLLSDYTGETDLDDLSDAVHGEHPDLSPEQVDALVDAHLRQRAADYLVGRRALAVLVEAADGDHETVVAELTAARERALSQPRRGGDDSKWGPMKRTVGVKP